ncbi:hypothetical protein CgunFtcFv8_006030 [Champsocephalus gunnari]|uniref:Uncharacterized protein n=1 Tax=Champsocephalus gunnari TaxID=52237 RepID=A0AAN8BWF6_CHAGU|nr:hypothetical protein CgunFtcFv8_006030 [Champsocephalus gunnari]
MLSATLVVTPDRSQFFQYESINLNKIPAELARSNRSAWSCLYGSSSSHASVQAAVLHPDIPYLHRNIHSVYLHLPKVGTSSS